MLVIFPVTLGGAKRRSRGSGEPPGKNGSSRLNMTRLTEAETPNGGVFPPVWKIQRIWFLTLGFLL